MNNAEDKVTVRFQLAGNSLYGKIYAYLFSLDPTIGKEDINVAVSAFYAVEALSDKLPEGALQTIADRALHTLESRMLRIRQILARRGLITAEMSGVAVQPVGMSSLISQDKTPPDVSVKQGEPEPELEPEEDESFFKGMDRLLLEGE